MKSNNQASARHHYLQEAYLDKFTEDGHIDVINRQDGTVRPNQRPDEVANMKGLYTVTNAEGEKDGSFEGAFATDIEEPAIKIINNMTSIFPYVPRGEEKSMIAYYMALQYVRTLEGKRRFETEAGRLGAIELFNFANKPDEVKKHLQAKGQDSDTKAVENYRKMTLEAIDKFEIVPGGNMWLLYINDAMRHIAPTLFERYNWHIYCYDQPTFVTSDHPVVLRKIENDHRGTGFANADEAMFPLSSRHALILSTDPYIPEGVIFNPDPEAAEMVNYFVTQASYLEIYCPPSLSSQHSGKPLGKRAITTLSVPDELSKDIGFLKKYAGVLDKERPYRH